MFTFVTQLNRTLKDKRVEEGTNRHKGYQVEIQGQDFWLAAKNKKFNLTNGAFKKQTPQQNVTMLTKYKILEV